MSDITEPMVHHLPVRIYYEDTDAGGIVYHANYLRFCERARSEMLRSVGYNNAQFVKKTGFMFVVRHAAIEYFLPAFLDDSLVVKSSLSHLGGASATLQQDIYRDDTLLVKVEIVLVCVDVSMKAARIPEEARNALKNFGEEQQ